MRATLLLLALGLGSSVEAVAQRGGCFRGEPLPACRTFWITEAGYGARVTGYPGQFSYTQGSALRPSLAIGHLANVSRRLAVGAVLEAGSFGGIQFIAGPRARLWLSRDAAFDVGPGVIIGGRGEASAFTVDAAIMYRDVIGLSVRSLGATYVTPAPDGPIAVDRRRTIYAGLRLGSKLGVAGAAADALAVLAVIGAYLIHCSTSYCD